MSEFVDDLVALSRDFGMFERDRVCCGTVTVQQCTVLQALLEGPRDVGVLADEVGSSPSAMTRLLDGLVVRGWVDRSRDSEDRRRVRVGLTDSGQEEATRLRGLTERCIDAVLQAVPEDKRAQVVESAALLRQTLERRARGRARELPIAADARRAARFRFAPGSAAGVLLFDRRGQQR